MLRSAFLETMKKLDFFASPIPGFNAGGRTDISSLKGSFLSLIIILITAMFAFQKMETLLMRKNPDVTTNVLEDAFDADDKFKTAESNFMMAFAFDIPKKSNTDFRYFKWVGKFRTVEGSKVEQLVQPHPCVASDYAKFYPTGKRYEEKVDELKQSGSFYCIDWDK